jgi:tRNA-specific 2-thiouridylase
MPQKKIKNKKVLLALSGGIDSSVSLLILKNQGFEVSGVTFNLPFWAKTKKEKEKILKEKKKNLERIKKICQKNNVKHYLIDLKREFEKTVVNFYIKSYQTGFTPNPCVYCNLNFKFYYLLKLAKKYKADFIATGHYAKVIYNSENKKYQLLKAKDRKKDQSYYLCFLNQKILKKTLFPLGDYLKQEVYEIAKKAGLPFIEDSYKESQNFCYLSLSKINDFLKYKFKNKKGLIIEKETSKVLGSHYGYYFFTIGQRKGLFLDQGPYYVIEIDPIKNIIYVSKNKNLLKVREIFVSPFNIISAKKIKKPFLADVKIRSQTKPIKSQIIPFKNDLKIIALRNKFFAPSPGQVACFYQKDICLGGGIIKELKI